MAWKDEKAMPSTLKKACKRLKIGKGAVSEWLELASSDDTSSVESAWVAVQHEDGRTYYHNEVTNETSWEPPGMTGTL